MYLKEMVYRVLQREQYARLLAVAAAEAASNPVSAVLIISEFRARFGVTPRTYSDAHALSRELRTQRDDQLAAPRVSRGANELANSAGSQYNSAGMWHAQWNGQ